MDIKVLKLKLEEETLKYIDHIIHCFPHTTGLNAFRLDTSKQEYSLFEKVLYDIYKININQCNIEESNDHIVTFFVKKENLEFNNIHFDRDDLSEYIGDKTGPIISSISYFNRSTNPFLYTNLSKNDIFPKNDVILNHHVDNKKECSSLLYWPDKNDHVIFNKNNFHGEVNIENKNKQSFFNMDNSNKDCNNCENNDCKQKRYSIVFFIWDSKSIIPLVPVFQNDYISYKNMEYQIFKEFSDIENFEYLEEHKNQLLNISKQYHTGNSKTVINYEEKKINIVEYTGKDLNYFFYCDLIFNGYTKVLDFFTTINDYDILNKITHERYEIKLNDYNNIFLLKTDKNNNINDILLINNHESKCHHYLDMKSKYEFQKHDYIVNLLSLKKNSYLKYPIFDSMNVSNNNMELFNKDIEIYMKNAEKNLINSNALLNINKSKFNTVEKIVLEISDYYLQKLNIPFNNDIIIEFWIKHQKYNTGTFHLDSSDTNNSRRLGYDLNPFLTSILYLDDNEYNYTLISNLTNTDLKFNNFKNKIISFVKPTYLKLISFFGGQHFHGNIYHDDSTRRLLVINYWYKTPVLFDDFNFYKENIEDLHNRNEKLFSFEQNDNIEDKICKNEHLENSAKKVIQDEYKYESYFDLIKMIKSKNDVVFHNSNNTNKNSGKVQFKIPNFNLKKGKQKKIENNNNNHLIENTTNIQNPKKIKQQQTVHYEKIILYFNYLETSQLLFLAHYIQHINIWKEVQKFFFRKETDFIRIPTEMQKTFFSSLIIKVLELVENDNKLDIINIKIIKEINSDYKSTLANNKFIYIPLLDNKEDTKITLKDSYVFNIQFQSFFVFVKNAEFNIQSENIFLVVEYSNQETI